MDRSPTRKELSHQRIVDAASRALRRSGYAGTGVADIMKEAGLTHGGFYAHFESRDALLAEAVAKAGRDNAAWFEQRSAARADSGASALRVVIESYLRPEHLAGVETGCVVSAVLSEMPRQTAEVRAASAERIRRLIERVRKALPAGADAAQAAVIASTLVGALQLARGLDDERKGKAMLKSVRDSLLEQYDRS
ncbi:MAG TPA: TetR/AcrR family transcriptional regulator [Burkholderiaceae bacterium]|nr:TetR/AcrR family transcriptional regulator [Burkholderiaceae bacterium]